MLRINRSGLLFFFWLFATSAIVRAQTTESFSITLKNHLFTPARIEVPANKKVKLIIDNQDNQAEEFDSFDLNREKVLFPMQKSVIYIGPLAPGEYRFFGEFSPNTAQGVVVVKEVYNAP